MLMFISIFFILLLIIFTSKIDINIEELTVENLKLTKLNVKLEFRILKIIKIFSIKLNTQGVKMLFLFIPYNKLNFKKIDKNISKEVIKKDILEKIKLYIKEFEFDMKFCSCLNILDMFICVALSTLISVFESNNQLKINLNKFKYNIKSDYGILHLNITLRTIISVSVSSLICFFINNMLRKK